MVPQAVDSSVNTLRFAPAQRGTSQHVEDQERAFATLTMLIAVTERAMIDLEALNPPPSDVLDELRLVRDDVTVLAQRLSRRDDQQVA